MKTFLMSVPSIVLLLAYASWPLEHSVSASPIAQKPIPELEKRVERLETMVRRLTLKVERLQITNKDSVVEYDYEDGFSIMRFYQLKPFTGKLKACQILKPADSFDPDSEGPTCRLTIERAVDGKTIIIDEFKTLPSSKETLDMLMQQDACNFPHDIWSLRHSALYD